MDIYLNNAATTWPKPRRVPEAVADFLARGGANLGRGASSRRDRITLDLVLDCRIRLARLFDGYEGGDPRYVTFCSGVTEALNVVLKGFFNSFFSSSSSSDRAMRVISTSMEHNAVVRPLRGLEIRGLESRGLMDREGVRVTFLECGPDGALGPSVLRRALGEETFHLMVLNHASNVCGTVQPLEEIAGICREAGVPLVLDSAQTAGILPISVSELGLAALCFTGHKGLMGPQGIGGIVWNPDFASRVAPFVEGGTGSFSHLETQPSDMPDKFEAGTPNLPGIAGLHAALGWLADTGIREIGRREEELGERFLEGLSEIEGAVLYGRPTYGKPICGKPRRLAVFAVNFRDEAGFRDNGVLADLLSQAGFETRPGLHCAPLAHRTLGSFPLGSLRVSPGYFNTLKDMDAFLEAVKECVKCTSRM
ncbi:MAG: aminotransferase class V-fold PLP-dependent enzyme [Synergistaceae bacterium]|jgi:selenocysteine lyase/cysteine desulfurase|nr:aminotransferase class V-fold PLP-dependent enzyme [Synergistaceae bacterium]